MIRARVRALSFVVVLIFIAATTAIALVARDRGSSASEKPCLLLLTSLPLMFSEDFSIHGGGSAAIKALEARFTLAPISTTSAAELSRGRLLMMAHPAAQTADNLVALDKWVREGGRVLLLADPALEWPSTRPLGDPLRPLPMFMDTGLLGHWGLRLDTPERRGPAQRTLSGRDVVSVSPGELYGSGCAIAADRFVARCHLGRGWATVVADADFLNADALGADAKHNFDGLTRELLELEGK